MHLKRWAMFIPALFLFAGCVSGANIRQKHQQRLEELDAQYKAGEIDAVQYQAKYAEEVQDYNSRRVVASDLISHNRR